MHIAVSLCGEGSGHATRMSALCQQLAGRHRVTVWCPEHTREFMRPLLPECRFESLPWIRTVYDGNRVKIAATVRANAGTFLRSGKLVGELARALDDLAADAVVSDYEPFLVLAARRARIPAIRFSNQAVIDRHPALRLSWLVAWLTNRLMMPPAQAQVVSSFYNGDVGALVRSELAGRRGERENFVLVYARHGFAEQILPVLKAFPGQEFRIFPSDRHDFAQSLAACRGVIAPAGHQLTSEAAHLGRPLLAFPQENQYEQELNARMLERSGWGMRGRTDHTLEDVDRFLRFMPYFPLRRPDRGVLFRFHDCTDLAAERVEHLLTAHQAGRRQRPLRRSRRVRLPRVAT